MAFLANLSSYIEWTSVYELCLQQLGIESQVYYLARRELGYIVYLTEPYFLSLQREMKNSPQKNGVYCSF
jgi:hypothetical protein